MKNLGYSQGYIYDHDTKEGCSKQNYWPENLEKEEYYIPQERGFERELKKRIAYLFIYKSKSLDVARFKFFAVLCNTVQYLNFEKKFG
jgi:replication-associated recombination protein RarA